MPVPCKEVHTFWENVCEKRPPCSCPLTPLRDGHGQAGSLSLRFWPVDHSIPGAGAFGINTTGSWVIYTGDLLVTPGRKNFWRSSNHPPPRHLLPVHTEGFKYFEEHFGTSTDIRLVPVSLPEDGNGCPSGRRHVPASEIV